MTRLLWAAMILFAVGAVTTITSVLVNVIWPLFPIGLGMYLAGLVLCEVQKDRSRKQLAKAQADHEAFLFEIKRRYGR